MAPVVGWPNEDGRMTRVVGGFLIALAVVAAQSVAQAAQKRAYKPAERSQQASDEQAPKPPPKDGDGVAPAATYEQELQAAKDKRDKDLEALNSDQPDRRTLEKRKQEIFSQYAAIVAALRDKYEASQLDAGTTSKPGSRYNTKAKGGRDKKAADDTADAKQDDRKNGKGNKKKTKDADGDALAEALEKLDEENARHASRMEELNADLRQAQSSNNVRDVRKAEKAIEKENNTYSSKKAILERRVKELGGSIAPPAPPPKPAAKDAVPPPAPADAPPPAPAK
jgi:hypothetical protein